LYLERGQYRARAIEDGKPWVYFGRDHDLALVAFLRWEADGRRARDRSQPTGRELMRSIRKNAAARGLSVSITAEEIERLLLRARGRCEITGIAFDSRESTGHRMRPWRASVDRIDRAAGYTMANCRIVCSYANLALNEYGEAMFLRLARGFLKRRKDRRAGQSVADEATADPQVAE